LREVHSVLEDLSSSLPSSPASLSLLQEGIDFSILCSLPVNIQIEVVKEHERRNKRQQSSSSTQNESSFIYEEPTIKTTGIATNKIFPMNPLSPYLQLAKNMIHWMKRNLPTEQNLGLLTKFFQELGQQNRHHEIISTLNTVLRHITKGNIHREWIKVEILAHKAILDAWQNRINLKNELKS